MIHLALNSFIATAAGCYSWQCRLLKNFFFFVMARNTVLIYYSIGCCVRHNTCTYAINLGVCVSCNTLRKLPSANVAQWLAHPALKCTLL